MAGMISRGLSLILVAGYVVAVLMSEPPPPPAGRVQGPGAGPALAAAVVIVAALFPLSLIWFPDFMGEWTWGRVTRETPGHVVAVGGWVLLIGVGLALYWFHWR